MDRFPGTFLEDRVKELEHILEGRNACEKLRSALLLLDAIGADVAAAHVARAIDELEASFRLDETGSKTEPPLPLASPGS